MFYTVHLISWAKAKKKLSESQLPQCPHSIPKSGRISQFPTLEAATLIVLIERSCIVTANLADEYGIPDFDHRTELHT